MNISVIICSINVNYVFKLCESLKNEITENDEVLLIVDGKGYLEDDSIYTLFNKSNWNIIVNEKNKGLSYSRNLGMETVKNKYCIFFDDDTKITPGVISKYKSDFDNGYYMVGGVLRLPEEYPELPIWFPDGMTSLLGVHSFQEKIWGANFGFNIEHATKNNIKFRQELGRKGRGLESGDDTTFIKDYCGTKITPHFDNDIIVYHYINPKRYHLKYLLKRMYWQGVSEVRRNQFKEGMKKEVNRLNYTSTNKRQKHVLLKKLVSLLLLFIFVIGAIKERIF